MSTEFIIRNQAEIANMLRQLPKGYDAKFLRKVLAYSVTNTVKAAQAKAPSDTGIMKASLGKIQLRRSKFVSLVVGPRVKGAFNASRDKETNKGGWYAHFVEFGTQGYTVKKTGPVKMGDKWIMLKKGDHVKGQPPRPFMRPAFDGTRPDVENRFFSSIKRKFEKEVARLTKKGVI